MLHDQLDLDNLFRCDEREMISCLLAAAEGRRSAELLQGLFGPTRQLYKRFAQFSAFQSPEQYQRVARRPFSHLVVCAQCLAEVLGSKLSLHVAPHEVLFDAPPVKREVQFNVQIHFPKESCYRLLGEVSPVVRTLAERQFDDYVKRVRVFVHPRLAPLVGKLEDPDALVGQALDAAES
jgi:hypothetical protein